MHSSRSIDRAEYLRLAYEDAVVNHFGPITAQARAEFPAAYAALADRFGFGGGPLALHLAIGPGDDDFVTMSVWESWAALETATGGDVQRPVATRHPERIERWDAAHFEIIGG
jgi:hypothetical protein